MVLKVAGCRRRTNGTDTKIYVIIRDGFSTRKIQLLQTCCQQAYEQGIIRRDAPGSTRRLSKGTSRNFKNKHLPPC